MRQGIKLTKFVSYTMNIGFLLNEVLNLLFSRKIHISKNENVLFCSTLEVNFILGSLLSI